MSNPCPDKNCESEILIGVVERIWYTTSEDDYWSTDQITDKYDTLPSEPTRLCCSECDVAYDWDGEELMALSNNS